MTEIADLISRRALVRRAAVMWGGSIFAPLTASALIGCARAPSHPAARRRLDKDGLAIIADVAEQIIPQTDTPGASAAGVPAFIERLLANWFSADEREAFLAALSAFEEESRSKFAKPYLALAPEQRVALLEILDRRWIEGGPVAMADISQAEIDAASFFGVMKEMTIVGYYTSQEGADAIGYYGGHGDDGGEYGPNGAPIWI